MDKEYDPREEAVKALCELLCLAFNIATEDDGGNTASPKPTKWIGR